jgi:hopanoid-associated phosphorylase
MGDGALPVVLVSGLAFESRIAEGPGIRTVCWAERNGLLERLERAVAQGCAGLVSFGTCGALAENLSPGDWLIPVRVLAGAGVFNCHDAWREALAGALSEARSGPLAGVDSPVTSVADKAALHEASGALAADMESHVVARVAQQHELPFVVARVVIDPAARAVPASALAAVDEAGQTVIAPLLAALARHPSELGALLRLARDSARAQRSLRQGRSRLEAALRWPARAHGAR